MKESKIAPELLERFKELPESVQNIILNSGWEEKTRKLVEKYKLRIDEGAFVETETMLIMFGFIPPEDFTKDLIKKMGIEPEIAQKLEREIGELIFKHIKDQIRVITDDEEMEDTDDGIVENKDKIGGSADETPILNQRLTEEKMVVPRKIDPYLEPID